MHHSLLNGHTSHCNEEDLKVKMETRKLMFTMFTEGIIPERRVIEEIFKTLYCRQYKLCISVIRDNVIRCAETTPIQVSSTWVQLLYRLIYFILIHQWWTFQFNLFCIAQNLQSPHMRHPLTQNPLSGTGETPTGNANPPSQLFICVCLCVYIDHLITFFGFRATH